MRSRYLFKALFLTLFFFCFTRPVAAGSYIAGHAYVWYQGQKVYLKGVQITWKIIPSEDSGCPNYIGAYRTVLTGDPISYMFCGDAPCCQPPPPGTCPSDNWPLDCTTQDLGYGSTAPACEVNANGETVDSRGNINYVFPRIGCFGCTRQRATLSPSFPEGYDGLPGNLSPENGYWRATGFTVKRYQQPVFGVQIIWDEETQTLIMIDLNDADEYAEIDFEWVPENREPECGDPALEANPPKIATSSSSLITALATDPDGDFLIFRRWRVEEGGGRIYKTGYNTAEYLSPNSIAPDEEREITLSYQVRDGQGGMGEEGWITCYGSLMVVAEAQPPSVNHPPLCGEPAVTLSKTPVYTGELVFLTGWASDEDGDLITYDNWQVDRGDVSPRLGKTVLFSAPDTEGEVNVSFEVSDGEETVICSDTFEVIFPPGGKSWFQTSDGDVHANFSAAGDGIISEIPSTVEEDRRYFSLELLGSPGIASVGRAEVGTTRMFFGDGEVSARGWKMESYGKLYIGNPQGPFDFDYFYKEFGSPTVTDPKNFTIIDSHLLRDFPREGFYFREGDLTIEGNNWLVSGKTVFLITGNLTIKNQIEIPPDNFLAFIVKGDINIDSRLGTMSLEEESSLLDGVFITSGKFRTGISNLRLVLSGIFVSYGGFELGRDLGMGNDTTPPELFLYRPDFVINAPDELKKSSITWQEVAP